MTAGGRSDEFYVGYHPVAPDGLARFVRRAVVGLVTLVVGLGVLLAIGQSRLPVVTYEYGKIRSFEGRVSEGPYPSLVVGRPGARGDQPANSRYLLSLPGKHGAAPAVRGLDGHLIRLDGRLIYRGDQVMVEVLRKTISPRASVFPPPAPERTEDLGVLTLTGEIIDSKCYIGIMNPGNTKPHRDCAVRCISGGEPPMLAVWDSLGSVIHLLLVDDSGAAVNHRVLGMVAEPVEITGRVTRLGDQLVLAADPATYRRRQ